MPTRPVPVLMMYDPEEFWAEVRARVREEVTKVEEASAVAEAAVQLLQTALDRTGLPLRPAYTLTEIRQLFRISEQTLAEWIRSGLVRTVASGSGKQVLFAELLHLFKPAPPPIKRRKPPATKRSI